MTLSSGATLGPYSIVAPLGAGGMGEVYRARDSRLDRDVAIKVLPESMARDRQRILRFEREAKALATLSHPNIAGIYGFEEHDGKRLLVMELAEGETLAERLERGALPIDESLDTARKIAEALEAAHEKGIVHRDLKPANVKVGQDGAVKVLDFGLAKALLGDGSSAASHSPTEVAHSPTITAEFTRPGMILGTAGYMSPEQARGRSVDKRTDIWAFGCVFFECLSGARLFAGETATDSIGAILHKEPEWALLPLGTPPTIQLLLRRCLAKDRNKRLRDIGDARIEIESAIADPSATSLGLAQTALAAADRKPRRFLKWVTAAVGILAAGGAGACVVWFSRPDPPVRKFEISLPGLESDRGIALSPDGRKMAYFQNEQIWVRDFDRLEPRPLPDTQNARNPFWSPDSGHIGYMRNRQLWRTSVQGGATVICSLPEVEGAVGGGSWDRSGRVVFATGRGDLYEVSAKSGEPRPLHKADKQAEEIDFHHAAALPNRAVLFVVHTKSGADTIAMFADGSRRTLLHQEGERFFRPTYSPTGHVIYDRLKQTPGIWALPISPSTLEVIGEPFLIAADAWGASVSPDGTLAFIKGNPGSEVQIAWVDREGKILGTIGQPQMDTLGVSLSPDGARVAVSAEDGDSRDIWIHDAARGTKTRFTFSPEDEVAPQWSPDGKDIAYGMPVGNGRWAIKPADGAGAARDMGESRSAGCFTPDGLGYVYVRLDPDSRRDLWYLPLGTVGEPRPILKSPANERAPQLSPDGSLLAYVSDESGRDEIYLTRFPTGEGKWQVSADGGQRPVWNRNGRELFFLQQDSPLCAVDVQVQSSVAVGAQRTLFDGEKLGIQLYRGYDVAADGERFVVLHSEKTDQDNKGIIVVENWYKEFKDRP